MTTRPTTNRALRTALFAAAILAFPLLSACGGGGGGATTGGTGGKGGLVLLSFDQSGQDNVPLNRVLRFLFSGPIDASSVYIIDAQGKQRSTGAIQVREGTAFGLTVTGTYAVNGSEVTFKPQLPGVCDLSDAGLKPDVQYRVTVVGHPEALAVRALSGVPLDQTQTAEFHTRLDDDPQILEDQIPTRGPTVVSTVPADGTAEEPVHGDNPATAAYEGNEVVVTFSENIHPCSIRDTTVLVHEYQRGDVTDGFVPANDQFPSDPYRWSNAPGVTTLPDPQSVPTIVELLNDFDGTELRIRPTFTRWPDNALIVVELTFEIRDFGDQPLTPIALSFTTQNLPAQAGVKRISMDGETPFLTDVSTADVNTARAVSRVQGYLLFAGDGDNGTNLLQPSLPETPASGCSFDAQQNDGLKDNFDPQNSLILDTGASVNTCPNTTDGSTAVVWQFNSFRIRPGVIVRVIGVNPAILLVLGNVTIEAGGTLLVRGDGQSGSPQGRGQDAGAYTGNYPNPTATAGGIGVAGGERGGDSAAYDAGSQGQGGAYGKDGTAGVGSPTPRAVGGLGAGQGNTSAENTAATYQGTSAAGGGGGHASAGSPGASVPFNVAFAKAVRGAGGGAYPTSGKNGLSIDELGHPSAGSGGGAAGCCTFWYSNYFYYYYSSVGGAGGAGGGFMDITSSGDILVQGTIDAAGSRGGNGGSNYYSSSAGGGGGSGGGIRLLTPGNINVTGGTITTAGGQGGTGGWPTGAAGGNPNKGGTGSWGRIVLEDGDSIISGLTAATLIPGEGAAGFVRQQFNAARFQGGGLSPEALTDLIFMGPTSPTYIEPVAADFAEPPAGEPGEGFPGAAIPNTGSRGFGKVGIVIEASGHAIDPDGQPNPTASPFFTIGWFTDSGVPDAPDWVPASDLNQWPTGDIGAPPLDNAATTFSGGGIAHLNGYSYLQFRFRFPLPQGIGPFDEGPYVNDWALRFSFNQ